MFMFPNPVTFPPDRGNVPEKEPDIPPLLTPFLNFFWSLSVSRERFFNSARDLLYSVKGNIKDEIEMNGHRVIHTTPKDRRQETNLSHAPCLNVLYSSSIPPVSLGVGLLSTEGGNCMGKLRSTK
jgi:hypothetical protein